MKLINLIKIQSIQSDSILYSTLINQSNSIRRWILIWLKARNAT